MLPNGSTVTIDGKSKHIIGYLQDFLFTPERAKTRVRYLSGGERNRLLLAQLFTQPANLLVLDEPTNDLDSETLELLEELLVNFQGTVLLICHDRAFLDNVVTSTWVFTGDGAIAEYVGGYQDWRRQQSQETPEPEKPKIDKKKLYKEARKAGQTRKLSFKESKELESLPARIESLEGELAVLHTNWPIRRSIATRTTSYSSRSDWPRSKPNTPKPSSAGSTSNPSPRRPENPYGQTGRCSPLRAHFLFIVRHWHSDAVHGMRLARLLGKLRGPCLRLAFRRVRERCHLLGILVHDSPNEFHTLLFWRGLSGAGRLAHTCFGFLSAPVPYPRPLVPYPRPLSKLPRPFVQFVAYSTVALPWDHPFLRVA